MCFIEAKEELFYQYLVDQLRKCKVKHWGVDFICPVIEQSNFCLSLCSLKVLPLLIDQRRDLWSIIMLPLQKDVYFLGLVI